VEELITKKNCLVFLETVPRWIPWFFSSVMLQQAWAVLGSGGLWWRKTGVLSSYKKGDMAKARGLLLQS
jgi:hypothetical protein